MDDTDQPHDDQPSDMDRWSMEMTEELTRHVIDGDLLPTMFSALRTAGNQLKAHETQDEPLPMDVDDMLNIALAHVFYQALIDAYPELTEDTSDLSYVEALREHAT